MLLRERKTVTQLYRSVYDRQTLRSRTQTVGSFAKNRQPPEELLARLTEAERTVLKAYLAQRDAVREAEEMPRLMNELPEALQRVAAWMRGQPKTPELRRAAKRLRDGYAEVYSVMRALGMARLREAKAPVATEGAKPARERRRQATASGGSAEEGRPTPAGKTP